MRKTIVLAIVALLLNFQVIAIQTSPKEKPVYEADDTPTNCEHRIAVLDGITQSVGPEDPTVVISRLGDGDVKANLGWRRLSNIRAYWTQFLPEGHGRKKETIILASGERVSGFGQIEFYAGGKLVDVMKVARNADLYIGECYPPDERYIKNGGFDPCKVRSYKIFYPCLDNKALRRVRAR